MDPSRISLEDDRFGLIGISFRPQNRATYAGRDGDDHVWAVGIVVGDDDEIQTVEIDDHGAKSSRMLTPGELFEGLEILAAPGPDAHLIVGTFTLLGMDLRASGPETAVEFAQLLRAAADDRNWRLPLHLIGQPRDLQLSAQGREILRQTAATIELEGQARTTLSAAQRLELSPQALDSIRRRIARKSLQAYRMHGRWYVVLDNLARSRTAEMNGASSGAVPPPAKVTEAPPSPFEEVPSDVDLELEQPASTQVAVEEPPYVVDDVAVEAEPEPEQVYQEMASPGAVAETVDATGAAEPVTVDFDMAPPHGVPSDEDLSAFVAAEQEAVTGPAMAEMTQALPYAEAVTEDQDAGSFDLGAAAVQEESQGARADDAGIDADQYVPVAGDVRHDYWNGTADAQSAVVSEPADESPHHVDQVISETVLEQFIMTELDVIGSESGPAAEAESTAGPWEQDLAPQSQHLDTEASVDEPAFVDVAAGEPQADLDTEFVSSTSPEANPEECLATAAAEPEDTVVDTAVAEAATGEDEGQPDVVEAESVVAESTRFAPEAESAATDLTTAAAPQIAALEESAQEEFEAPESSVPDGDAHASDDAIVREDADAAGEVEEPSGEEAAAAPLAAEEDEMLAETPAHAADEEPEQAEDIEVASAPHATGEAAEESASRETGPAAEAAAPGPQVVESGADMLMHLRDEVAFLRQQGQEKDRQIVAWINGAQWLQPFVDQIRSLEQQVERLGDLQVKRDGDRISDLMSERDTLRQRLASLEAEIASSRAAKVAGDGNRRSWFRKMMGSD